jgi:putative RecB family exonuclease
LCDWCDHKVRCPAWGGTPPPLPDRTSDSSSAIDGELGDAPSAHAPVIDL